MPFYGNLESLIEYAPPVSANALLANREEPKEPDALEGLLTSKVRCLADILDDINSDIAGRLRLSRNVIYRIYQHYLYLKSKLMELYLWPLSGNRAIEQRRAGLEKQLDLLKQEKRAEQVQRWQDVSRLKSEFRKWLKEYRDLAGRVNLIVGGNRRPHF